MSRSRAVLILPAMAGLWAQILLCHDLPPVQDQPLSGREPVGAVATVVCIPSTPSVSPMERVDMRAFVSPARTDYIYKWSVSHGKILGTGPEVQLDFSKSTIGRKMVTVEVLREGKPVGRCSAEVLVVQPRGSRGRGDLVARTKLLPGQKELSGCGLYGYLLLGSRPDSASMRLHLQVIRKFVDLMPDISEFLDNLGPSESAALRKTIFVSYVPVKYRAEETNPNAILSHYDYGRAKSLLSRLPGTHPRGPYLVFSRAPLSERFLPAVGYHQQDLSLVPDHLVALHVDHFLNLAAQQRFDDKWDPERLLLEARTILTHLGEALTDIDKVVGPWQKLP